MSDLQKVGLVFLHQQMVQEITVNEEDTRLADWPFEGFSTDGQ